MEKYKNLEKISEGAFGIVYRAKNIEDNEVVAIKEFKKKYTTWDECKNLREVKSLINLKHDNIVKLKEMIRSEDKLYLVFEFMDNNLYDLIKDLKNKGKKFTENQIRYIMYHNLLGIAYMHKHGFFHRDLKPENLLVKDEEIKIADFGLAREIRSLPPYTDYVSTRWYRAPECILKSNNYNSPIDIWALGAIMAELFNLNPLFPGNNEKDLLYKISSVIGSPNTTLWNDGINLAKKIDFKFPLITSFSIKSQIPDASEHAIEALSEMLKWDPNKRPTANKLLSFSFFNKQTSIVNIKISSILNDKGYNNVKTTMTYPKQVEKETNKNILTESDNEINKCTYIY